MSLAPRLNSLDSANAPNLSSLIIRCGEAVGIPTHPDRRRRWFRQSRKGGNYERRNNHVSISRVTNMITCWKSVSGSSEQGFLTLYPNPPTYTTANIQVHNTSGTRRVPASRELKTYLTSFGALISHIPENTEPTNHHVLSRRPHCTHHRRHSRHWQGRRHWSRRSRSRHPPRTGM